MIIKVKRGSILPILNALMKLDDSVSTLDNSKDKKSDKADKTGYDFSPSILFAFAKNVRKLKIIAEDIENVRIRLIKKYAPNGEKLEGEVLDNLNNEFTTFMSEEMEVDFHQIKEENLSKDIDSFPNNRRPVVVPINLIAELLETVIVPKE